METDQLDVVIGTQEEVALIQDSDAHSQIESPITAPPSIKSPSSSASQDALEQASSSTAGSAPQTITGCLDDPGQGVQIDLGMSTAPPHHLNQTLDQQSRSEQQSTSEHQTGSISTQISRHHHQNPYHPAYPQQSFQHPHQSAGPHRHIKFQRQAPTFSNRSCTMAEDFNVEDWKSKHTYDFQNSGYGQPQSQMHTTFPPTNPQFHDGSFNVGMNQAASYPGHIGVGPYFNQQPFLRYTHGANQAQPTHRGAPNGYTDSQICLPYPNPNSTPQENPFHTGPQNQHLDPSCYSQQLTPHTTGASLWNQYYDQNHQVTASPAVLGYHQNRQPQFSSFTHDQGSDQASHPRYDEYQDQPFQQSTEKNPHRHYQQHTHHRASIDSEDNEIVGSEANQYNDDDGDQIDEDGDHESIDNIFGEGSTSGSRSPEHNHERPSPREKSQLFVHGSDDEEYKDDTDGDIKNENLQTRRHHKFKVFSANDNNAGNGGVPRGTNNGFSMPGTASEYRPSRSSGALIPQLKHNKIPETKNGRYVSNASLKKRGLNRVQKNRVAKRASGANDPENIKIVHMYDNDGIHSYDEIAERINNDRRKQGRAPDLTGCAVSARYARTAPILYKAEGKVWIPPSKRKGPITGPSSIWNEELDLRLVSIKQEVDSITWQQVANRFNQETGNHLTVEQISTRYAAI